MKKVLTLADFFALYQSSAAWLDKGKNTQCIEKSLWNKHVAPVFKSMLLTKITRQDIELFLLKQQQLKAGTLALLKAFLSALFREALNRNLLSENPAAHAKLGRNKKELDNSRTRFLTSEEIKSLFSALEKRAPETHKQALLSLHTGMRAGEIFNLTWQDVNFETNQITIKAAKNGKTRYVFMDQKITQMLRQRQSNSCKPSDLVFPSKTGGKIRIVSTTFGRVVAELGLNKGRDDREKIVFHSLRHTAASFMVNAGISIFVVQKILGHASVNTTQRYAHLDTPALQNAFKTLERKLP